MTISSTVRTAGPFLEDGSTVLPFAFKVFEAADLVVTRTNAAQTAQSTLTLGADYTVSLNADQDAAPGGSVNLLYTVPGYRVNITSGLLVTQGVALTNNGGFYPRVIERALDRLTILLQQLGILSGQALRVPPGESVGALPPAGARAGHLLAFDAAGKPTTVVPTSGSAAELALDLLDAEATSRGAGQVAFGSSTPYQEGTVGRALRDALASVSSLLTGAGASLIGFIQSGAGAIAQTIQELLREDLSVSSFGAVLDGSANSAAAVQACINAAFARGRPTVVRIPGIVRIDTPISFPAGGHVEVRGGTIIAGPTFPTNRYLFELVQPAGLAHHDLKFDLTLDANRRGGCIRLDNYISVDLTRLRAFHFTTDGVRLDKTSDSHECNLNGARIMEYLYGEPGYTGPYTGVGVNVNSFDNIIQGVVCYYTGTPIRLNAQYNLVTNCHVGSGDCVITANAAFSSFNNNYIDSGGIVIENPWHTELQNNKFLHNTADASKAFVTLKPLVVGASLQGFKSTGNSFHNINAAEMLSYKVDISSGTFDSSEIGQCEIDKNSYSNVTPRYTRIRRASYQTGATDWVFDLAYFFPFGAVQWVQASFRPDVGTFNPQVKVEDVGGTTVTVSIGDTPANGTAYIEADVNKYEAA